MYRYSSTLYEERLERLQEALSDADSHIKVVEQTLVKNIDQLYEVLEKPEHLEWEGLMIRCNAPFEAKRTDRMLKIKNFERGEYKVLGIEKGPMQIVDKAVGRTKSITTLLRVNIEHKGKV